MTAFPFGTRGTRRTLLTGAGALSLLSAPAGAQLTIRLNGAPRGTPVYVAGSFNQWNPAAPEYRLTPRGAGVYTLTLPDSVRGPVEFKFTLGSWDTVELSGTGGDLPNRTFTIPAEGAATYTADVARWRDPATTAPKKSTATKSVSILSEAFEMPRLGRTRRVWLYLPPDYATSGKRYPVLYMHDGQNVFDDSTSYAGEWGVDETLDSLHAAGDPGVIVVAVDNGQSLRLDEYSPWVNARLGGGEGDEYVDFLVNTLKPHVDRHYRTRPDRLGTGIAGSSMGGMISLYAALKYPEVFGRVGVFSPAFWFAPSIFSYAAAAEPAGPDSRFYFVTGALEGTNPEVYVRDHHRMVDTLAAAGFRVGREVESHVRADGRHAEWFWRREFPAAYRWLFAEERATR